MEEEVLGGNRGKWERGGGVRRTDVEEVPKGLAVFAVVEEEFDGFLVGEDGFFEAAGGGLVGVFALQETAVSRDDVGAGVAGDFEEAVGGEGDGVVCFAAVVLVRNRLCYGKMRCQKVKGLRWIC